MKKMFLAIIVFVLPLSVFAAWECETEADCSKGMRCLDSLCKIDSDNFSSYAAITVTEGENSPNDLGSNNIFVPYPATDVVLAQLTVEAVHGGADGKYYLFKELNLKTIVSSTKITASDIKLVYDENGNGIFDSNEKVVALDESELKNRPKLVFDQKRASYLMNKPENFLVLGSFTVEVELDQKWEFGTVFNPFEGAEPQAVITCAGDVVLASVPASVVFPRFVFEPDTGHFLLSSGEFFPTAPQWPEMNAVHTIMYLRAKSLDSDNELKALNIRLDGTAVSYGNGVKRLTVYSDDNNDGKGDTKLVEKGFETLASQALLTFPAGSIALKKGEEKFLVVEAELEFYSGQVTKFYISQNGDVQLVSPETVMGVTVSTQEFKYNCDETDEGCRLNPDDIVETVDEGGCSVLLIK